MKQHEHKVLKNRLAELALINRREFNDPKDFGVGIFFWLGNETSFFFQRRLSGCLRDFENKQGKLRGPAKTHHSIDLQS